MITHHTYERRDVARILCSGHNLGTARISHFGKVIEAGAWALVVIVLLV